MDAKMKTCHLERCPQQQQNKKKMNMSDCTWNFWLCKHFNCVHINCFGYLLQQEETDYGDHLPQGGVRQYLNLYKKFSENFTMALKLVITDDYTKESLVETKSLLEALKHQIPQ